MNHELLIKASFKRPAMWGLLHFWNLHLVQMKHFDLDLELTNVGRAEFPGARIVRIDMRSTENQTLTHTWRETRDIPKLKPGESCVIPLSKQATYIYGTAKIECRLSLANQSDAIQAFVYDPVTNASSTSKCTT